MERGFKNIISPFAEMVENREWQSLEKHKESMCLFGKGILCKYGRKRRKKSVCQRTVDIFQQRRNQQIV